MGNDRDIKIISMNSSKVGRGNESYLRKLLDVENPDLCLLPGDNGDIKKCTVCGYKQYLTQGNSQPVLLYDTEKVRLKWSPVSVDRYAQLPGINFDELVCPEAEIPLGPGMEPKHVSILVWDPSMTRKNVDRRMQAENIIRLAQDISLKRQIPTLIGGDFNFGLNNMEHIVKDVSSQGKKYLNKQAAESGLYPAEKWLPSISPKKNVKIRAYSEPLIREIAEKQIR